MRQIWADLIYGFRMMKRAKAFTVLAVLTLAIGIGANTAMFSVIYGVLLRPLPFQQSDRLVQIWHTPPQSSFPGVKTFSVSPANYLDWKAQSRSFEGMAAIDFSILNLTGAGEPEALQGRAVSPDFFSVLRVAPMMGRAFAPQEEEPANSHVVVLSYSLWQTRFGGNKNIVGQTIRLDETPYTVIGVMPPSYHYPEDAQFWVPLAWTAQERAVRGAHDSLVIARLKDGATMQAAQVELDTISRRLEQEYPADDKGWGALVMSLQENMVGDVKPALLVLLGAVFFVLLIACVNVANLMLAKVLDRRKEIAVRTALGASRGRILKQILAESVALAAVGGLLGALLAVVGERGLVAYLADELPRVTEVSIDYSVLAFTLVISVFAGIITGVAPAWKLSNVNVHDALKQGAGRGAETGGNRTRSVLVVCEVALSLMLLAGAGLLLRSLWKLQSVDPGFNPKNVLVAYASVPGKDYDDPQKASTMYTQLMQQLRGLPGVQSVGLIDSLPMGGGSTQPIAIEGRPVVAMSEQPEMPLRQAGPGYFSAMQIKVLRGREFNDGDVPGRPRVVIISKSMAERYWPNEDPIGKHLTQTFAAGGPREVIGVVDDVKVHGLEVTEDIPTVYTPLLQQDPSAPMFGGDFHARNPWLVVRGSINPAALIRPVTNAVHSVLPTAPVENIETMEDYAGATLAPQRFNLFLLGTFAALALLLATLGVYSLLAYSVRRRTAEIGIRIALGAQMRDVFRLVIGEGVRLVLIGVVSGLVGALALSRFLKSMIFNVPTTDLPTFFSVALMLMLIALAASYLPARRAMRVDPMTALREE